MRYFIESKWYLYIIQTRCLHFYIIRQHISFSVYVKLQSYTKSKVCLCLALCVVMLGLSASLKPISIALKL